MTVVSFDFNDFIKLLRHQIPREELIHTLPMIGADFESATDETLAFEFFPNRPDLASVEGIARAARAFFGYQTGLQAYEVKPSSLTVSVDPSVKEVRPFVVTALVTNVVMTDELIKSLMDMQEKLHAGLGRNRKKVAIGVHNFEPLTSPFTYKAVDPDSVSFVPLAKTEEMTLREILSRHEKGVDYAHILDGFSSYPLIVDAKNNVLSFPPIINGSLTEVTPSTRDLFIDVTGTDQRAIHTALTIITTALAERGGQIYSTTIHDGKNVYTTPDLTPNQQTVSLDYINTILGTSLAEKDIITCLKRMGYNATIQKKNSISVQVPAWRSDILHEIDIIEDVAIGFGYDKFETKLPQTLTFGKPLKKQILYDALRTILIGFGFNEVTTFTISNEKNEFIHRGMKKGECVELENPIGEDFSCLRVSLLPSLLMILKENKHHPLPQQIFELGIVVDEKGKNHRRLCAVKIDAKANFTLSKSLTEAVMRDSGVSYSITESKHPAFIPGRCADVVKDTTLVGVFGELHPHTITAFELEHPIIALEVLVDVL